MISDYKKTPNEQQNTPKSVRVLMINEHSSGPSMFSLERLSDLDVVRVSDLGAAMSALRYRGPYDAVLVDLACVGVSGMKLLRRCHPKVTVVAYKSMANGKENECCILRMLLKIAARKRLQCKDKPFCTGYSAGLTHRQLDVPSLISEGCTNKVIARLLGIAEATAKAHVSAVSRVVNVSNRTQAAAMARRFLRRQCSPEPGVANNERA